MGGSFINEIDSKLKEIENQPDLYMQFTTEEFRVRRALCNRFPFSIYFINKNTNIIVIAVLHQRRNPVAWQIRNKLYHGES